VPEYDDVNSPEWVLMSSILTHWIADADTKPFLLNPIPLYHHIEGTADASAYRERFAELAASTSATLLDSYPSFSELSDGDRRKCRFEVDVHLTPYGHSILAEALEPGIRKLMGAKSI
jgi:carbamoyltransferase